MSRLTRRDMKRDEVRESIGRAFLYLRTHRAGILLGLGALFVAGLVGTGVAYGLRRSAAAAETALAEAVRVYQTPAEGDEPAAVDPAGEAQRRQRARELFEAVRDEYPRSDAAKVAGLYLARLAIEAGDSEMARALWEELAVKGSGLLAAEAQLNLASLARQQGNPEAAIDDLRDLLGRPDTDVPQDAVLYALGETLQAAGRRDEAAATFQRLLDEHPESPYAADARRATAGAEVASDG